MIMKKIYVASSWRNEQYPQVVSFLQSAGHQVYDFRSAESAFAWSDIDPNWQMWSPAQYMKALDHPLAKKGFEGDFGAMRWADMGVLVLPCGASAHLELGWMAGAGKRTAILTQNGERPELMAKLADRVVHTYSRLIRWVNEEAKP